MAIEISGLVTKLGGVLLIILIAILICGSIVLVVWLWMRNKQYKKYKALIFKRKHNKDGTITIVFVGIDKGAIKYHRKLKRRYLHLAKNNVRLGQEENEQFDENRELDIPSIPSEQGGEIIVVEKLGPKKFAIGDPNIISGEVKVIVSEADVAEAMYAYDLNAKYFGKEGFKWAGPIAFAVFAVLIIVLVAVVLGKFEILVEVTEALERTAQVLQAGKSAAVPSGVPV